MENLPQVPPMSPTQPEKTFSECITPPPPLQHKDENSQNIGNDLRKTTTPDRLKVPKAFKFPERYTSPTDMIMSPVTQGLLARNRKGGALLPPSINLLKHPQGVTAADSGIEGVGCRPTMRKSTLGTFSNSFFSLFVSTSTVSGSVEVNGCM